MKSEDKASIKNPDQAKGIHLAEKLFEIQSIDQLHFFQNVITVTKFSFEQWEDLEPLILQTIQDSMPYHDPGFKTQNPEKIRREGLSAELQEIESILDKEIRSALQADGGDLTCEEYHKDDKVLIIRYLGACGSCPASTTGTLEAIKGILRQEYDPEIQVYIAPEL